MKSIASPRSAFHNFFEPKSIALVGVSDDVKKASGRPLHFLERHGFAGKIYLVGTAAEIRGRPVLQDVADLPEGIDLALILNRAADVPAVLAQCAARGIGAAISVAGGFDDETGRLLQAVLRDTEIRLVGPNGTGLIVPEGAVTPSMASELNVALPKAGHVAIVTQSGAMGNAIMELLRVRGIGIRAMVSTGNEADVDALELIDYLIDDPKTKIIAVYAEGFKNGDRFANVARKAQKVGKPIIVRRTGLSPQGRAAAVSHTGKLSGAAAVWKGVIEQFQLVDADSLEAMADAISAFDKFSIPLRPSPNRLGILSLSGGQGVAATDAAFVAGLDVPPFSSSLAANLKSVLPPRVAATNPIDLSFTDESTLAATARALVEHGSLDGVIVIGTGLLHKAAPLAAALENVARLAFTRGIPLIFTSLSPADPMLVEFAATMPSPGILILPSPERSVRALAAFWRVAASPSANAGVQRTEASRSNELKELPSPRAFTSASLGQALEWARSAAAWPLVLKVVSSDIPHKTEVGGVAVGLNDEEALTHAWQKMERSVVELAPDARLQGFQLQEMVRGVEVLIGCTHDPEFGPTMTIGWGGILAEVINDTSSLLLPVSDSEIRNAISRLKIGKMLAGVRGEKPADIDALVDAVQCVAGTFLADESITEMEINPVVVRTKGNGAVAVDSLIIRAS